MSINELPTEEFMIDDIQVIDLDEEREGELLNKVAPRNKSGAIIALTKIFKELQPGKGKRLGPFRDMKTVTTWRQRMQTVAKNLDWSAQVNPVAEGGIAKVKLDKSFYSEVVQVNPTTIYLDIVRTRLPGK
jgi:hypothetical protein